MNDPGVRAGHHGRSGERRPPSQVHAVAMHGDGRVEPSQSLEHRPAHEHAARGAAEHRSGIVLALADLPGFETQLPMAGVGDRDPELRDAWRVVAAARPQQHRDDDVGLRGARRLGEQAVQRIGSDPDVVVEQPEPVRRLASCKGRRDRLAEPPRRVALDDDVDGGADSLREDLGCGVVRAVVDGDDASGTRRQRGQRTEGISHPGLGVARHQDSRHHGPCGHIGYVLGLGVDPAPELRGGLGHALPRSADGFPAATGQPTQPL